VLAKLGHLDGVSVLVADLGQGDYTARRDAAAALGAIGSSDTVPALLEGLRDRHQAVRRECAMALGVIGDADAIPLLEECRLDIDEEVRMAINAALCKIRERVCWRGGAQSLAWEDSYLAVTPRDVPCL